RLRGTDSAAAGRNGPGYSLLEGFTIVTEKVLIAGCGDLGYRSALRLLAQGHEVWGLRRHPPSDDGSGLHWMAADMTRPDTLAELPQGITQLVLTKIGRASCRARGETTGVSESAATK